MNIVFFNIDGFPNKIAKVSAGVDENNPFVEFSMNIENIDPVEFETFRQNVDDCVSCTLCLGNDEHLKFDYEKSMVSFDLLNIKISFVNRCAPECLREVLCDLLTAETENSDEHDNDVDKENDAEN